jgi:hypothetical protein
MLRKRGIILGKQFPYHARIDDTLSKLGFVEKRHTTARLEFRLNISY